MSADDIVEREWKPAVWLRNFAHDCAEQNDTTYEAEGLNKAADAIEQQAATIDRLTRELATSRECEHYANATSDLAMKHRDVAERERDETKTLAEELEVAIPHLRRQRDKAEGELAVAAARCVELTAAANKNWEESRLRKDWQTAERNNDFLQERLRVAEACPTFAQGAEAMRTECAQVALRVVDRTSYIEICEEVASAIRALSLPTEPLSKKEENVSI